MSRSFGRSQMVIQTGLGLERFVAVGCPAVVKTVGGLRICMEENTALSFQADHSFLSYLDQVP